MFKNQYVIGLTGFARSGKGSVAEHLIKTYGFVHISFADILRELASAVNPVVSWPEDDDLATSPIYYNDALEMYGYDRAKEVYPEFRRFLQRMGTEGGRRVLKDSIWVDKWEEKTKAAISEGKSVVASDVRFLNEAKAIRELRFEQSHGVRNPIPVKEVWRINREGIGPLSEHSSELEQLNIEVDRTIENTTLNELGGKTTKALQDLIDDEYKRELALLKEIEELQAKRKGFIKHGKNKLS